MDEAKRPWMSEFMEGSVFIYHDGPLTVLSTGGLPSEPSPPSSPAPPLQPTAWREATMIETLAHAASRKIASEDLAPLRPSRSDPDHYKAPGDDAIGCVFEDGTAIACASKYAAYPSGSFAEPPEFWIGVPK